MSTQRKNVKKTKLSEWAEKHGVTHAQFARSLGVTRQVAQNWFEGSRAPQLRYAIKIVEMTHLEYADLLARKHARRGART